MRNIASFTIVMFAILMYLLAPTSTNAIAGCGKDSFPKVGNVTTTKRGIFHQVAFRFRIGERELRNLRCIENYVEIDFELRDFKLPAQWNGYLVGTNLPGGIKDTPLSDEGPRPSITNIHTKRIRANQLYWVTIAWESHSLHWLTPSVRLYWTPAHWARSGTFEKAFCKLYGRRPEYCLFGNEPEATRLHRALFPSSRPGGWLRFANHKSKRYNIRYDPRRE